MFSGSILVFVALAISFVITYKVIPSVILIANSKGITDIPDGERKLHRRIIPTLGGVAMFGGFLISYGILIGFHSPKYLAALIASLTIILLVGIKDDILDISCYTKLIGQIAAAGIIVFIGGIKMPGLDGLFGITSFPAYAGEVFSIVAIVIIINAYNLIDGIDGLAGMITILGASVFGVWFLLGGHYAEAILSFSLVGALVGFTFHNFEPAKIFMGDTGSQFVGFVMAILGFRLVEMNATTSGFILDAPAVFIFSVMIIPLFDTLRVIAIRLSKGEPPMKADSKHMHHYLLRMGLRHSRIALYLLFYNVVIILVSLFINSWEVHLYISFIILIASSILPVMNVLMALRKINIIRQLNKRDIQLNRKKPVDFSSKGKSSNNFHLQRKHLDYSLESRNC